MSVQIKNIVFDLGNVLITLDQKKLVEALEKIDPVNFHRIKQLMKDDPAFKEYEAGLISSTTFMQRMAAHYPHQPSLETLEKAWNAMLIEFSPARYELLQSLRNRYRLFLLSNTNEIHVAYCDRYMQQKFGVNSLESLFEKAWYSYLIKMRKPHPEIFNFMLSDARLQAAETLFIDDLPENTAVAASLGIHTWTLPSPEELTRLPLFLEDLQ